MAVLSERWALIMARGYALAMLLIGLALLFATVKGALSLVELANGIGALAQDDPAVAVERAFLTLGLFLACVIDLALLTLSATLLFLASGLWRMREWARHGVLVYSITAIPALIVTPIIPWLFGKAGFTSESLPVLTLFSLPFALAGLFIALGSVYLFAYRFEIIALYTPRPSLVRRSNKITYGPTTFPRPPSRKK